MEITGDKGEQRATVVNLLEFFKANINKNEYYYQFQALINDGEIDSIFEGLQDKVFYVYDTEDAISKFRELCQPKYKFDGITKSLFYLVSYYLYKNGYEIQEFPRVLERPPREPEDFTYSDIRNKLIAQGDDDNGTVRYATRRVFVANLTFEQKTSHVQVDDVIDQKFIEISNRNASFNNMSTDEQLAEIANLIEHMLKQNGKFISLNYSSVCFDYLDEADITSYRKKMHCFRHSTAEAIAERKAYTDEQKSFFVDYGLTIIKVIHSLQA